MKEGEEWKTAFYIKYKHFKYIVISFRFINIPATIQYLINNILREYLDRFYTVYLNNILIFLDLEREYVGYIKKIFKAL